MDSNLASTNVLYDSGMVFINCITVIGNNNAIKQDNRIIHCKTPNLNTRKRA